MTTRTPVPGQGYSNPGVPDDASADVLAGNNRAEAEAIFNSDDVAALNLLYKKTKRNISAAGSTAAWNEEIVADTAAAPFAIAAPTVAVNTGEITITNIGANTLTITGTISGVVNPAIPQWSSRTFRTNGSILYFV
jgi:hypothetical protein